MTGKRRAGRPASQPPAAPAVGRAPTRREQRAERRRQRRRRLGAGGIAGVVVLVLALLAGGGFFVHNATSGPSTPTDPQQTMLVALTGADRSAAASMLVAHQASPRAGFEMLIPSRLLTDVCGYGSQQFGRVYTLPRGAGLASTTLSQVLGKVTIDSTLTLTEAQFARLIDGVGGVAVDVDTDVITSSHGTRVVAIPKGNARLNGTSAVLFATYVAAGEPPAASLTRFQAVFEALLTALPRKASATAASLRAAQVEPGAVPAAATLFTELAADDKANRFLSEIMPSQPIDSGGGTPSYRTDPGNLKSLVASQLGKSTPAGDVSKQPTVLIQNGVGTSGLVLSACNRLLPAGFTFAGSGNAQSFNYPKTQIFVFPPSPDDLVRVTKDGDRVADLLKLPRTDVVASTQGNNVADVLVILGRDYKP